MSTSAAVARGPISKVVLYVFLSLVMAIDVGLFLFALFAMDEDAPIWRVTYFKRSMPWMKRHGPTVLFFLTFFTFMAVFLSALYST